MDQQVFELTRQLQARLGRIDIQADRDTFVWIHGFLVGLIDQIETSMPHLKTPSAQKSAMANVMGNLAEAHRTLNELTLKMGVSDNPDSLEQIERELGGTDPDNLAGVPSRLKPSPKGLSGGVALPLPDSDFKM
jgi:hypothetical protein